MMYFFLLLTMMCAAIVCLIGAGLALWLYLFRGKQIELKGSQHEREQQLIKQFPLCTK